MAETGVKDIFEDPRVESVRPWAKEEAWLAQVDLVLAGHAETAREARTLLPQELWP